MSTYNNVSIAGAGTMAC